VEATAGSFVTHWGGSRWAGGSYSVPGVGLTAEDEAAWTHPWGSLVFAGEHTGGAAAGSMNGAAVSGARAARVAAELIGVRADA
jgi:monoamine oxidase